MKRRNRHYPEQNRHYPEQKTKVQDLFTKVERKTLRTDYRPTDDKHETFDEINPSILCQSLREKHGTLSGDFESN